MGAELGLNSVQMQDEKLVDMSSYKMDWSPMEVPLPLKQESDENSAPQGKKRKLNAAVKTRHWCLTCKQVNDLMHTIQSLKSTDAKCLSTAPAISLAWQAAWE